jgi:hypothetical protein
VGKYEKFLNSIYCLSEEACSTITDLRSIKGYEENVDSCRLYILLEELHTCAFEAFKTLSRNLFDKYESISLSEIFDIGSSIKETFEVLCGNTDFPCDHKIIRKLGRQLERLALVLYKLNKLEVQNKILNVN